MRTPRDSHLWQLFDEEYLTDDQSVRLADVATMEDPASGTAVLAEVAVGADRYQVSVQANDVVAALADALTDLIPGLRLLVHTGHVRDAGAAAR